MAKVRAGNADLKNSHGHSGPCWAALRAADPKSVGKVSPCLQLRSPALRGCCQHPPVMSTFESAEGEQRTVPGAEAGESDRVPMWRTNPHSGAPSHSLFSPSMGGLGLLTLPTGLSCWPSVDP